MPVVAQDRSDHRAVRGQITDARGVAVVRTSVSIVGTSLATLTDDRGEYYLANVPAGSALVGVASVGYRDATTRLDLPPGGTQQKDFRLGAEIVELGAFVVGGSREGQARNSGSGYISFQKWGFDGRVAANYTGRHLTDV